MTPQQQGPIGPHGPTRKRTCSDRNVPLPDPKRWDIDLTGTVVSPRLDPTIARQSQGVQVASGMPDPSLAGSRSRKVPLAVSIASPGDQSPIRQERNTVGLPTPQRDNLRSSRRQDRRHVALATIVATPSHDNPVGSQPKTVHQPSSTIHIGDPSWQLRNIALAMGVAAPCNQLPIGADCEAMLASRRNIGVVQARRKRRHQLLPVSSLPPDDDLAIRTQSHAMPQPRLDACVNLPGWKRRNCEQENTHLPPDDDKAIRSQSHEEATAISHRRVSHPRRQRRNRPWPWRRSCRMPPHRNRAIREQTNAGSHVNVDIHIVLASRSQWNIPRKGARTVHKNPPIAPQDRSRQVRGTHLGKEPNAAFRVITHDRTPGTNRGWSRSLRAQCPTTQHCADNDQRQQVHDNLQSGPRPRDPVQGHQRQ